MSSGVPLAPWAAYAVELLRWSGDRSVVPAPREPGHWASVEPTVTSRGLDSLHYLAHNLAFDTKQQVYDAVWQVQRRGLAEVVAAAISTDIAPVLLKGVDSRDRYFDSRAVGLMNDCDVLVERGRLGALKQVLYGLGYRQATYDSSSGLLIDRDVADIARIEARHYELAPFVRLDSVDIYREHVPSSLRDGSKGPLRFPGGQPAVIVEIDVHHRVAEDIESAPLIERARPGTITGSRSLAAEDMIWWMASKYYTEVALFEKDTLRDLAYLAPALTMDRVDWSALLRSVAEYELHAGLYYVLGLLSAIVGKETVPGDVFARLSPETTPRRRDWGWQVGKLLGFVEPLPLHA